MLARAGVEAVDTRPEQLRVSARAPQLPAVAVHEVVRAPWWFELRILAASHQVVVRAADGPRDPAAAVPVHVETVACGLAEELGRRLEHDSVYDHGDWQVAATVVHLAARPFAEQADAWVERGRRDGGCVVVQFPNHPAAITALAVEGDRWVGVHL